MKTKFTLLFLTVLVCIANTANAQSGNVFNDLNGNGIKDAGEPGIAGFTVKAYKQNETILSTAVTDSMGNYTLPTAAFTTQKVRVEFNKPSAMGFLRSSFNNAMQGGSVQFRQGNQANTNYAVINPAQSINNDPILVHSRFVFGNQTTGAYKDSCVLFGVRNSWGTNGTASPQGSYASWNTNSPYRIATASEVGSIYGVVYSKRRKTLYTSAFFRQFNGFGPNGAGAIYKIPYNLNTGLRSSNPSLMVDVTTLAGQSMPTDPHGTDLTIPESSDTRMAYVTKYSLGDLEISEDETKIYTVNLFNREVVAINPDNGALVGRWAIPTTGLTNSLGAVNSNDVRPFALGYRNGKLYVGAVCTGQSTQTANNTYAGALGNNNALHAYVWELNEITGTFTLVLNFKLNTTCDFIFNWQDSWTNGMRLIQPTGDVVNVAQPILSDIDFYGDDMIVGFRNRSNDQRAINLLDASVNTAAHTKVWGDIVGAKYTYATGKWMVENNGTIGNRVATGTAGTANGFNEFYRGDGSSATHYGGSYKEVASGAFVQLGNNHLASLQNFPSFSFDVTAYNDQGGVVWMNNQNGAATKGISTFEGDLWVSPIGKTNGLGAIEAVTETIPIEIGNRVWNDADGNGLQSADENGYSGIIVQLLDATMTTVIATNTTNSDGYYLFDKNNVPGGLQENTIYKLRISNTQFNTSAGLGILAGTVLTAENMIGSGMTGVSDNDAVLTGGVPVITFTTGAMGENNHDLDFGFKSSSILAVVNITKFNAVKRSNDVLLSWETSYEQDLASFEVERSIDGTQWTKIATVAASVNSSVIKIYSAIDIAPIKAKNNLYRLRQVGTDATIKYSEIRIVKMNNEGSLTIFPNPAKTVTNVTIPASISGEVLTINITNQSGQTVKQVAVTRGATQQSITVAGLAAGIYNLTLTNNNSILHIAKLQIIQ